MYLYVEIASTELQSYRYPLFASSLISILYPDIFYSRIVGLPLRKRKKRQSDGCQGTVEPRLSQHSSRNSLWSFVWQLTQRWYDVCRWPNMYINGLFSAVLWQDMLLISRILISRYIFILILIQYGRRDEHSPVPAPDWPTTPGREAIDWGWDQLHYQRKRRPWAHIVGYVLSWIFSWKYW